MANFGFIIDNRKCIGCHACTVACKSEHDVPLGVNRTWVKYIESGTFPQTSRSFSVLRCNHCDNAPCIDICPVTALYRRADGIVDFDNRRCIGCRACMQACPYDALYIDPETRTAAKCNYCAHRVDRGLEPACVNVCPTHAIVSGDLDDPHSEISLLRSQHQVTVRKPEKGTLPALFYIDGDRLALDPAATEVTRETTWSAQTRGVGHYGHYSSGHTATSTTAPATIPSSSIPSPPKLSVIDSLEKFLSLGDGQSGVLNPQPTPESRLQSQQVAKEIARRTYDSPQKGALWGWQVTAYIFTKAIATGAVIIPFVAAWRLDSVDVGNAPLVGAIIGMIFLALTGALLAGDLDQPKRFLYVLLRPQWKSWLVRGAYIIMAFTASLVLWLGLYALQYGNTMLEIVVVALSVLTAIYTAFLFAQAKSRDFWQSPWLSVHMLIQAILAGGAVFVLGFPLAQSQSWIQFVRIVVVATLLARFVVDGLELGKRHATADLARTIQSIVSGYYRRLFWWGVVAVGGLLPLVLLIVAPKWTGPLAALAIWIGIYISEHIWVRAPQRIPLA